MSGDADEGNEQNLFYRLTCVKEESFEELGRKLTMNDDDNERYIN